MQQPNQTLYVNNLNDRVSKQDLKLCLYAFFSTHGTVLDIVCLKTPKMRGQAHIVFRDVLSATEALKAGQGVDMLGKPMRIAYAKGVSDYIRKLEGTYQLPQPDKAMSDAESEQGEDEVAPRGVKRSRDADEEDGQ
jgi:RNA recognition motif-containing protein